VPVKDRGVGFINSNLTNERNEIPSGALKSLWGPL
jgi:hypothetical protein